MKKLEMYQMENLEGGKDCASDGYGFIAGATVSGLLAGGPLGGMIGGTIGLIGGTFIMLAKNC